MEQETKINELIEKCKISITNDDDDAFMNLFMLLKKKLKSKIPITTRKPCVDLADEYDGLFFNLQVCYIILIIVILIIDFILFLE